MGRLRTSEVFSNGPVSLIAVESVRSRHWAADGGFQLYANIQPVAVVVCRRGDIHAFDMAARPIDLDRLVRNAPEIRAAVSALRKTCYKGIPRFDDPRENSSS